jgi:hypothetical protein
MHLPRRVSADGVAALLLLAAAAVLLATPYDGGACRNVAAAYALPAASLQDAEPPGQSPALTSAALAAEKAESDTAALEAERAEADKAREAAQQARQAANDAESELYAPSFSTDYVSVYASESEVSYAKTMVRSAEDWLDIVQEGAADTSPYGSFYDQQDVQRAQEDLDDARAKLTAAQGELEQARKDEAAQKSSAESAEQKAKDLDAAADAAEQAAADAATTLADHESDVEQRLWDARSQLAALEDEHKVALAAWSHEQRLAGDDVTALNNVRASCRENGAWRAGVALVDVVLLAVLALRRWGSRLRGVHFRLPRPRLRLPWPRR